MAMTSDTSSSSFRLSMLIYDTRYRSITIQIVFLFLFMAGFAWLVDNTLSNLAQKGKDIDFGFLGSRAGYDINQMLVEYTNDSSHARAWLIGLLNTLVLAICACVTATVIGVIAGVLRLSKNWIVSKLMGLYVEMFRNVPVLLWIIVIFAVLTEITPAPNAFRGDNATSSMLFFDTVAITNRGTYIPSPAFTTILPELSFDATLFILWGFVLVAIALGVWALKRFEKPRNSVTTDTLVARYTASLPAKIVLGVVGSVVLLSAKYTSSYWAAKQQLLAGGKTLADFSEVYISLTVVLFIAVIAASIYAYKWIGKQASAVQEATGVRPVTWWKSALVLIVPITVVCLAMGFHLEYPSLQGFNFQGGGYLRNSFIAMWLALSVYTGAFIAENVRAGILAISRGQSEAAFAVGLRPGQTMNLVILPQALRVIIPPLISQYLNITKNTSLAIAVGYMDLRATLGGITLNQTGRELECMLLLMLTYLIASLIISGGMNVYNNSVKLKER